MRVRNSESYIFPSRVDRIKFNTLLLASGQCSVSQSEKMSFTEYGKRNSTHPADRAPAAAEALRIPGISWSVRPGITGAIFTPTGTPALANFSIAPSRACGAEV